MKEKIRVIIADDCKPICDSIKNELTKHDDIEILGIANTNEDEINMIEELKPDIVITDLMRQNHQYGGLEIIKEYNSKNYSPKFLIVSADSEDWIKREGIKYDGYIEKCPITFKYKDIIFELRKVAKRDKK